MYLPHGRCWLGRVLGHKVLLSLAAIANLPTIHAHRSELSIDVRVWLCERALAESLLACIINATRGLGYLF
jgi:hypothetical protein